MPSSTVVTSPQQAMIARTAHLTDLMEDIRALLYRERPYRAGLLTVRVCINHEVIFIPATGADAAAAQVVDVQHVAGSLDNLITVRVGDIIDATQGDEAERHRFCVMADITVYNRHTFTPDLNRAYEDQRCEPTCWYCGPGFQQELDHQLLDYQRRLPLLVSDCVEKSDQAIRAAWERHLAAMGLDPRPVVCQLFEGEACEAALRTGATITTFDNPGAPHKVSYNVFFPIGTTHEPALDPVSYRGLPPLHITAGICQFHLRPNGTHMVLSYLDPTARTRPAPSTKGRYQNLGGSTGMSLPTIAESDALIATALKMLAARTRVWLTFGDRSDFQRLAKKAHTEGVTLLGVLALAATHEVAYVTSSSSGATPYLVIPDMADPTQISCTCQAGLIGTYCKHAALVQEALGH